MCQNSFIKQYLAKQQELLRQRLEREAQQEEEADGMIHMQRTQNKQLIQEILHSPGNLCLMSFIESPGGPEEDEDHSEDNDNSSFVSDKVSSHHMLNNVNIKLKDLYHTTIQKMFLNRYFTFSLMFHLPYTIRHANVYGTLHK